MSGNGIGILNLQQALSRALIPAAYSGVVGTGSTATTVVDAVGGWAPDQWANYGIQFTQDTTTVALRGVWQKITGNTANTLNLAAALPATPQAGDTYVIRPFGAQAMTVQAWAQQPVASPAGDDADAVAPVTGGIPRILARLTAWTGAAWSRLRLAATGALQVRDDATGTPAAAPPSSAMQVAGTDGVNLRVLRVGADGRVVTDLVSVGGTAQTGADWTSLLQKLNQLDITLSALRDAITAAPPNARTLNDLYTRLAEVLGRNIAQIGGVAQTGEDWTPHVRRLSLLAPIQKANVFNTAVAAEANILAAGITPTNTPSLLRVLVAVSASAVFRLVLTRGATTVVLDFNQGTALTPNALYLFGFPWRSGDSVNFRISAAATVLLLTADEVGAAA